jgi:tape measure domain-containing protein
MDNYKIRLDSEADVSAWVRAEKSLEATEAAAKDLQAQLRQADPGSEKFAQLSREFIKVQQSARDAKTAMEGLNRVEIAPKVNTSALDGLKQGLNFGIGNKIIGGLESIPNLLVSAVQRGVEFNTTMNDSELAIAKTAERFMGLNSEQAKAKASGIAQAIQAVEPETAGDLKQLVEGYLATAGAATAAGVSMEQNVQLTSKFANALSNAKLPAEQLKQEMRSIMTGNIGADSDLAKTLGITNEGVRKATEQGKLYDYLIQKIGAYGEAGDSAQAKFSSLTSAVDQALGALGKPVFDGLIVGANNLTRALQDPQLKESLKSLGTLFGNLITKGSEFIDLAARTAGAIASMPQTISEGAMEIYNGTHWTQDAVYDSGFHGNTDGLSNKQTDAIAQRGGSAIKDLNTATDLYSLNEALAKAKDLRNEISSNLIEGKVYSEAVTYAESYGEMLDKLIAKYRNSGEAAALLEKNQARLNATLAEQAATQAAQKEIADTALANSNNREKSARDALIAQVEAQLKPGEAAISKASAILKEARKDLEKELQKDETGAKKPGNLESLTTGQLLNIAKNGNAKFTDEAIAQLQKLVAAEKAYQDTLKEEAVKQEELALARKSAALEAELITAKGRGDTAQITALTEEIANINNTRSALKKALELDPTQSLGDALGKARKEAEAKDGITLQDKKEKQADLLAEEQLAKAKLAAGRTQKTEDIQNDPAVRALEIQKEAKSLAAKYEEAGLAFGEAALARAKEHLEIIRQTKDLKQQEAERDKTVKALNQQATKLQKTKGAKTKLPAIRRTITRTAPPGLSSPFTGLASLEAMQRDSNRLANALQVPSIRPANATASPQSATADINTRGIETAATRAQSSITKLETAVLTAFASFRRDLDSLSTKIDRQSETLRSNRS